MAALMLETEMATKMEISMSETITEMTMETETREMIMEAQMVGIHARQLSTIVKMDDFCTQFSVVTNYDIL